MPLDPSERDDDDDFVDRWVVPESSWDPEDRWNDPEKDLVSIPEPPTVGGDEPSGTDSADLEKNLADVDSDLLHAFVVAVVLANIGLLLVSLGAMLWFFRGDVQLGGGLILIGVLALVRMWYHYRSFRQSREDDDTSEDATAEDDDTSRTTPTADATDAADVSDAAAGSPETDAVESDESDGRND